MVVNNFYNNQPMWVPSLSLRKLKSGRGYKRVPSSRMHFLTGSRKALQEYLDNLV